MKEFLVQHKVGLTCEDVYFSFLPLAHIFDR
jgi:long-subunit acyl-CoA synthetase (AMP-forming)